MTDNKINNNKKIQNREFSIFWTSLDFLFHLLKSHEKAIKAIMSTTETVQETEPGFDLGGLQATLDELGDFAFETQEDEDDQDDKFEDDFHDQDVNDKDQYLNQREMLELSKDTGKTFSFVYNLQVYKNSSNQSDDNCCIFTEFFTLFVFKKSNVVHEFNFDNLSREIKVVNS